MQVTFVFEVDATFMYVPLLPPTKENCAKCCLDERFCFAMEHHDICMYGGNGYFVLDGITEAAFEGR
jgi:hypothetical protein